jgi:DNA polymerase-3 subunit delta'
MPQDIKFNWSVIGHKNILEFLEASVRNDWLAHAYLFYGPSHVGKTTVALRFISLILKQDLSQDSVHPDVYWIKREPSETQEGLAKNISIKQIRELEQKLSLSSFLNSYKIAIIEEAETLSIEACDSLLKTLEEPTSKTIIILISKFLSLPETILSRCQILKFLPVPSNEIYQFLIEKGANRELARNLSFFSLGRPGIALSVFEELNNHRSGPMYFKNYQETVNLLIKALNSFGVSEKFKIANDLIENNSQELEETLTILILLLRDLLLIKYNCNSLICNVFHKDNLEKIKEKFSFSRIISLIKAAKKAQNFLGLNVNPKLVIENLFLKI